MHTVPDKHLKVFQQFLAEYSGICNFNYKALITFLLHQSAASSLFLDSIWMHMDAYGTLNASSGWYPQVRETGELSIFELNTRIGQLR